MVRVLLKPPFLPWYLYLKDNFGFGSSQVLNKANFGPFASIVSRRLAEHEKEPFNLENEQIHLFIATYNNMVQNCYYILFFRSNLSNINT